MWPRLAWNSSSCLHLLYSWDYRHASPHGVVLGTEPRALCMLNKQRATSRSPRFSLETSFSLKFISATNMGQFFLATQGTVSNHIEVQISGESLPSPCSSFYKIGRMGKYLPSSQFFLCVVAKGQFQGELDLQMSLLLLSLKPTLYCGATWRLGPKCHPRLTRDYCKAKMALVLQEPILAAQITWAQLNSWVRKAS